MSYGEQGLLRRAALVSFLLVLGLASVAFLMGARHDAPTDNARAAEASSSDSTSIQSGPNAIPDSALTLAQTFIESRFCAGGSLKEVDSAAATSASNALALQPENLSLESMLNAHSAKDDTVIYDLVVSGSCTPANDSAQTMTQAELEFFIDPSGALVATGFRGSWKGFETVPQPFGSQFNPCAETNGCDSEESSASGTAGQ